MPGDEPRFSDEAFERGGQRSVTLLDRFEEPVVCRPTLGRLPDAFDSVELRRVRRQAPELDAVTVRCEPRLRFVVKAMARAVIDDQEDLAPTTMDKLLEEEQERVAVEDRRELIREARPSFDRDRAEHVPRLAFAVCVDAGLFSDRRPSPVQTAIEPKARFVLERYDAATRIGFFFIFGNVSRSQIACAFKSALASRLRGRCTEKPSWCSRRGTW